MVGENAGKKSDEDGFVVVDHKGKGTYAGVTKPPSPRRSARSAQAKIGPKKVMPGDNHEARPKASRTSDYSHDKYSLSGLLPRKTPEGFNRDLRFLYDHSKDANDPRRSKLVAYRADREPKHFFPGQLIQAAHSTASTVFFGGTKIVQLNFVEPHVEAPVHSKRRPMVVLWKTQAGLVCLPILSLKSRPWGADSEHWKEYVSITSDDDYAWVGSYAKWAGRPLLAEYNPEPKAAAPLTGRLWINITNPITIGYLEEIDSQMGALQGDSYDRLMCALDHTERQLKEAAYVEWNEHYEPGNTEVWPEKGDEDA
ncbi:hypothetical protein E4T38_01417 [Aureobasidium subglaciale]|nr:hypothetical protein E4T38_01417 [Aureobasidium subglaciale]KAI5229683.1 hypothetical protein E4T40_01418 [Aureobasidium subglaciale]KAI5233360.1 hypothetical protein E4T41_01415 [Aureobasidium subglaciale]KAI5266623.1 hypothetical protein E4T46_01417 [Aureobasidium subglaciale]